METKPYYCNSTTNTYNLICSKINIKELEQEHFGVIMLNEAKEVLDFKILFKGGMTATVADTKIIFKELLSTFRCTGFITFHNHPSNRLKPSVQDIKIHNKIKTASEALSLDFVDNLILSDTNHYSIMYESY